jgi:hypothetical protein
MDEPKNIFFICYSDVKVQWLYKGTKQFPFEGKTSFSPIWCVKTKCGFGYVLGFCIQNAFRVDNRRQSKKQNTPLLY